MEGIRCVARPVFDDAGRMIAAVGISGPTVRINDQRLSELGNIISALSNDQERDGTPDDQ